MNVSIFGPEMAVVVSSPIVFISIYQTKGTCIFEKQNVMRFYGILKRIPLTLAESNFDTGYPKGETVFSFSFKIWKEYKIFKGFRFGLNKDFLQ